MHAHCLVAQLVAPDHYQKHGNAGFAFINTAKHERKEDVLSLVAQLVCPKHD